MALKRMGIVDNYQRIRDHASRLKAIPTELHSEEAALRRAVAQDDAGTEREQQRSHTDDEHARAGEIDPKIRMPRRRAGRAPHFAAAATTAAATVAAAAETATAAEAEAAAVAL